MFSLAEFCYVCIGEKTLGLKDINEPCEENEELLRIIQYFGLNLYWLKTILVCEECCYKLHEIYHFMTNSHRNSKLVRRYLSQLNNSLQSYEDNEANLLVLLNVGDDCQNLYEDTGKGPYEAQNNEDYVEEMENHLYFKMNISEDGVDRSEDKICEETESQTNLFDIKDESCSITEDFEDLLMSEIQIKDEYIFRNDEISGIKDESRISSRNSSNLNYPQESTVVSTLKAARKPVEINKNTSVDEFTAESQKRIQNNPPIIFSNDSDPDVCHKSYQTSPDHPNLLTIEHFRIVLPQLPTQQHTTAENTEMSTNILDRTSKDSQISITTNNKSENLHVLGTPKMGSEVMITSEKLAIMQETSTKRSKKLVKPSTRDDSITECPRFISKTPKIRVKMHIDEVSVTEKCKRKSLKKFCTRKRHSPSLSSIKSDPERPSLTTTEVSGPKMLQTTASTFDASIAESPQTLPSSTTVEGGERAKCQMIDSADCYPDKSSSISQTASKRARKFPKLSSFVLHTVSHHQYSNIYSQKYYTNNRVRNNRSGDAQTSSKSASTVSNLFTTENVTQNPSHTPQTTTIAHRHSPKKHTSRSKPARIISDLHKCFICNKVFLQKRLLHQHQKVHNGERPYQCPICLKRFSMIGNMRVHVLQHNGYRPFPCTQCDKRFQQKVHLTRHMVVHSGVKPYQCFACGKQFRRMDSCIVHERLHTGLGLFACAICGNKYNYKQMLARHISMHQRK